MNGDGRPDYVTHYNYTTGTYGLWVLLNTGTGFSAPQNWGTASLLGSSSYSRPRWVDVTGDLSNLIDMNGDGRPDYVTHYNYTTGAYGLWVFLNNGTGFSAPQKWGTASLLGNNGDSRPRWSDRTSDSTNLVDVNGDGLRDYVAHYNYTAGADGLWVARNRGPFSDLMNVVSDGLGATTTMAYTPSTQ